MKNLKHSLYWRLSLSFLLVLLILSIAYVIITSFAFNRYYQETTQKLNASIAEYLVKEVNPFDSSGEINKQALGTIMHSMMAVNPGIEVYLLDESGEILSYVVFEKNVRLKSVSLSPIKEFLSTQGEEYVLGDNPRLPGHQSIFSATEVYQDNRLLGYIYIILAGEKHDNIAAAMKESFWLNVGVNSFIITLIGAFILGLILIWLLTRNIRMIIQVFRKFQEGNLNARIPLNKTKGELRTLASTYNKMADTILKNIDELKKTDHLRRELIANVSHDLRNPLAIIHGYIETLMLKSDQISKDELDKYLKIILDSSNKLTHLVSDLFELSKLDTGLIQPSKEPFFIHELLSDAKQKFSVISDEKNIKIDADIDQSLPMVFADLALIDRVIQNLLDNAVKYTPNKGNIYLRAKRKNGTIQIEIVNSGAGIASKDLPHIFDRYYKSEKNQNAYKGTGLGLAIVKKILTLHNCNIHASSNPNDLTTFTFYLPVYQSGMN